MMQNFALILAILIVVSGIISLIDILFFAKARKFRATAAPDFQKLNKEERERRLKPPLLADYARSLFFVFVLVFLLRSFVVEIYRVPSGSMLPTIQLNDFLLINKFSYGIRLPIINRLWIPLGEPRRGDVMVFYYPTYPQVDYIKTVIGLPGDHISMVNKQLYINGQPVPQRFIQSTLEPSNANLAGLALHGPDPTLVREFSEQLGTQTHLIYTSPIVPSTDFKDLVVPAGQYFVMGDNRDDSEDSRYWGFVSEDNLVGKAFMVLFSWDSTQGMPRWNRIGRWLPVGGS